MYKCACGDQPVAVADERQRETYLDGAYWCSGTLSLLDFAGKTKYVWNPYSLAELKQKLAAMDTYLECVSTVNDGSCVAPTDKVFEQQQVPLLNVYQACLSAYDFMQWNEGAFLMFDRELQGKLKVAGVPPVADTFGVAQCLLDAKAKGWDNQGCLVDVFLKGTQRIDYFSYTNLTDPNPPSHLIDSCLTFSGPAASANPNVSLPFTACLESFANRSGCDIPQLVWSGRSQNKVPVSSQHTMRISDEATRKRFAQGEVEAVKARVLTILQKIQREWTGDDLKITLFSAEGDSLHQTADCIMTGPLDEMELTPGPDGVEKVRWSRGSTAPSRGFELPCSGEQLALRTGVRDTKSPFTCGSPARRSVLKYFVRDFLGGAKDNSAAKSMVVKAVQELINRTLAAWSLDDNYRCTCANGTKGWECCAEQSNCAIEPCTCPEGFEVKASVACCTSVCGGLAGAGLMDTFTSIKGGELAQDLLSILSEYLRSSIWTTNEPWLKYDPLGAEAYRSSWQAGAAKVVDAGLFDATSPVVHYDEAAYPFQSTMWATCAGLLQQVMWTMPLDRRTSRPKGMGAPYDPIHGVSGTPNITYREEFIRSLTLEAFRQSPLYWHYSVRYFPSQSEVCERASPRKPPGGSVFTVGNNTAPRMGFSTYTLGGVGGVDCHCGWWGEGDDCAIPAATCARMVQLLGFSRICVEQRRAYNRTDHFAVLGALAALRQKDPLAPYPCPALQISEHWGLVDSDGLPYANATDRILREGASGFRVGNADWLFANQVNLANPATRVDPLEEGEGGKVSQQCSLTDDSIVDHLIDDLFPVAQGVRQSAPQSYCTRYGIELARLTVFQAAKLDSSVGQQQGVVDKWRMRCEMKLRQLAVCKSFAVLNATGAPQGTAQCPFTISVPDELRGSYAVTPGCLLVLWNSDQSGIYDPCLCVACEGQNLDIPGVLTTECQLQGVDTLVGPDTVPGEGGPPSLGGGSFMDLLSKAGHLQGVNTIVGDIRHWAVQTSLLDGDLLLDWWPDEWRHPVGYHVTPGCSVAGEPAHWKTFNASWRWDSVLEQMVLSPEVADPLLQRNAYGAFGLCRSTNYGMPMHTLNTMRACTRENANAKADPMVPPPPQPLPWADGGEHCAADPFSTPWIWTEALNPPRQWSVGTLHTGDGVLLEPFRATEWGPACGPYPLRTCVVDGECAAGLVCLKARSTTMGVCGQMQAGGFECAIHSQCPADRLCAGDGLCVEGILQVRNAIKTPVSFRAHSQRCTSGDPLDTWGTSTTETIPDILNASGLCSFRSWYENTRMAQRNLCTNSDTCGAFTGMQSWNWTSPTRTSQSDAFTDDVLKVQPHPCDRDYQHVDGFASCTPGDNYLQLRSATGNVVAKPAGGYARGNRTRTYRVGTRGLPLMHHLDNAAGPTHGFTGIPLTYTALGLGGATPAIMACRNLKVCGFQKEFRANGVVVPQRQVMDSGTVRGYLMNDLMSCGVFGYLTASGLCRIDFAVAPLAALFLDASFPSAASPWKRRPAFAGLAAMTSEQYTKSDVTARLAMLRSLPDIVLSDYIGGAPVTLQEYVTRSALFVTLFEAMQRLNVPVYGDGVGAPRQLYYLTLYGAYETPFAWWYKCAWLAGFPMGATTVSEEQCSWRSDASGAQPTTWFPPYDGRLAGLLGLPRTASTLLQSTTLLDLLVKLPGIVPQSFLDAALADFTTQRDAWHDRAIALIQSKAVLMCSHGKDFVAEFSARSDAYQLGRIGQAYQDGLFDLTATYTDANGATVCEAGACVRSSGFSPSLTFNANFSRALQTALAAAAVRVNTLGLATTTVPDDDRVALAALFTSADVPQASWDAILATFHRREDGCAAISTLFNSPAACLCAEWAGCSEAVRAKVLDKQDLQPPLPWVQPVVKFFDADDALIKQVDACAACGAVCSQAEDVFARTARVELPQGVELETYAELPWQCVTLTCTDATNPLHKTVVPVPFAESSSTLSEKVVVDEYTFNQRLSGSRQNPWPDAATEARERGFVPMYQDSVDAIAFDAWCKNTGNYPCFRSRGVEAIGSVNLTMRVARYYVGKRLASTITFFPCGFEAARGYSLGAWAAMQSAYSRASQIPGVVCAPTVGKGRRPGPASFDRAHIRLAVPAASTTQSSDPAYVLERVQSIVRNLEAHLGDDETCLQDDLSECDITVSDTDVGTMSERRWEDQVIQDTCAKVKADPILGCAMYPGEATDNGEKRCVSIMHSFLYCTPGSWTTEEQFRDDKINGCPCAEYWRFYHPLLADCLSDDATDPCKGKAHRDLQLTGRTLTYTYSALTIPCTASPTRLCRLADEYATYASTPMAACPGQSNDAFATSRKTAYQNLVRNDSLHTRITLDVAASGGASPVSPFDHMFLGLQPRRSKTRSAFQCGSCGATGVCSPCRTAPPCPAGNISVEMRSGLFTCVDCPLVTGRYCSGDHSCMIDSPRLPLEALSALDGWTNLTADVAAFLRSDPSPIDVALQGARWLAAQTVALGVPAVGLSYVVPAFMQFAAFQSPYSYNPLPVVVYSQGMELAAPTCGATGLMPDFTNCSYDTRRRNLRSFFARSYKVSDGIAIDPGATLVWKVFRSQLTQPSIPAWEAMASNKTGMFVSDLLDDRWCLQGNMADNICYRRYVGSQTVVDVLNPGLIGAFEPLAGCDTDVRDFSRVVSSVCSGCDAGATDINALEGGLRMPCDDGLSVRGLSESSAAPSNLCGKTPPAASQCDNPQGMLGRSQSVYDGQPVDSVYKRVPWASLQGMPAGLRDNTLFAGKLATDSATVSSIALSPYDIGGHYLSMVLAVSQRTGQPVLNIVGMPLRSYADAFADAAFGLSQQPSISLRWVNIQEAFEADALRATHPDPACAAWDCPLRRRAFYHGADTSFRPMVPDPARTQVLYGSKVHPTQRASSLRMAFAKDPAPVLGAYTTLNGFCACRTPAACLASCATDLDALMGGWRLSSVADPSPCAQQVDWPYAGGTLRDGSTVPERYAPPSCGLLDRLPPFKYRYWNSARIVPSKRTTLDRGGACAMGWPIISAGPLAGCYLLEDDTFTCAAPPTHRPVTRMRARTLSALLGAATRPRLADCRMPPSYRAGGSVVPSEVSYGQPTRREASRALAADLRFRLCGNATECEATADWSLPTFWAGVFMKDFPSLPSDSGANQTRWTDPWVACLQDKDTGATTCDGAIPREEWAVPARRGPACVEAMSRSRFAGNLTRDINVCDLDATLDQFCRTVQDGRYQVYEANCLYSGQCRQQLFFYQPSTYAVDNGEFVRSTVQTFYNNSVAGACTPDFDAAEVLAATAHSLENCAAVKLNVLVDVIQTVRLIMKQLVELNYYVAKLGLHLFSMIGQSDSRRQETLRQMGALLTLIKNKFISVFNAFGDIFYRVVMSGPLGKWLEGAIKFMCTLIHALINDIVYVVLCWTRAACLGFLQYVALPFVNILNRITFGKLSYLTADIASAQTVIKSNIPCAKSTLFSCDIHYVEDEAGSSLLPVATRCMAGVEPGIGSLGCSAADTCLADDLSLINCGMCVGASSMIKYGCNTLTKLCSCNVFPAGVSPCASHEECTLEDDSIDCQYVDTYLQPSYGNVPCRQCAHPICLVSDGSGAGQCSCLLRPVSNQVCLGVGQRVSPNAAELCLVASTASSNAALGTTSAYTTSYRTLASAPCLLLNQAQSYCMQVYTSASVSMPLVVGLSLLQRRRFLLDEGGGGQLLLTNASAWEGGGQPCRALVLATDPLGILERYHRDECWRWRDIGAKVVADENMTHVSPYFLVSWHDLLDALLTPDSIADIAARLPSIVNSVLLHSEVSQPVYIAVLYWTQLVPREIWANASVLDKTRDFFINRTFYYSGPTLQEPIPNASQHNATTGGRSLMAVTDAVTTDMAYEWSKGPYVWPPNYKYWNKQGTSPSCAVVSTALTVFKNALATTIASYTTPHPDVQPIVWPTIVPITTANASMPDLGSIADLEGFLQSLTRSWLDVDAVRSFVETSPWLPYAKSFVQCDFIAVQTCSQRRSLILTVLQVGVVFVAISLIAKIVEIPYVDLVLGLSFIPWVLYLAYGYAFTCTPLIPACLLDDVVAAIEYVIPSSIEWPPELVTQPGCAAKECMRSCRADPVVGFNSPSDHLAWIICEVSPSAGTTLARTINDWTLLYPLQAALVQKCTHWAESESMRLAQRVCFAITLVNSAPIIIAIIVLMWLAPAVLGVAMGAVQFALNTLLALVLFVHSSRD